MGWLTWGRWLGSGLALVVLFCGAEARAGQVWGRPQEVSNVSAIFGLGGGIALSGDSLIVSENMQGRADVFTRSGSTWVLQQVLDADGQRLGLIAGLAVALSGDTAMVAGVDESTTPGVAVSYVSVFTRTNGVWTLQQILKASHQEDKLGFGGSIALSGDTAVLGCRTPWFDVGDRACTSAYVFVRSGSVWTEQQRLHAANLEESGSEAATRVRVNVALAGDTAMVSGSEQGVRIVRQFLRSGSTWTEAQSLSGAPQQSSSPGVALDGDRLLVTSDAAGESPTNGSHAIGYVFTRSAGTWTKQQTLLAKTSQAGGIAALTGDTAVVATGSRAFVFHLEGDAWKGQQDVGLPSASFTGVAVDEKSLVWSYDTPPRNFDPYAMTEARSLYTEQGSCTTASDCASGHCVDGICCDTACDTGCQSCRAAIKDFGEDGACGAIAAGTDPLDHCEEESSSTCGLTGSCDGYGQCAYYGVDTQCAPDTCATETTGVSSYCSTAHACEPRSPRFECGPGDSCVNGACEPIPSSGGAGGVGEVGGAGAEGGVAEGGPQGGVGEVGPEGGAGARVATEGGAGIGGESSGGTPSGKPRYSRGCGCYVAGSAAPDSWPISLLGLALALGTARRYRRSKRATPGPTP